MIHQLTLAQRTIARDRGVQALVLALHHAPAVHYTMGPERWQGITNHKVARKGEYPTEADCSAMFSWAMWNAFVLALGIKDDVVNGEHWEGGFTGTIAAHGRQVMHEDHLLPMDAVLYGAGPNYEHVATFVNRKNGVPMVISHGSEAGPFYIPLHYRPAAMFRRHILKEVGS